MQQSENLYDPNDLMIDDVGNDRKSKNFEFNDL